jgi:phosphohistidine phosphatase
VDLYLIRHADALPLGERGVTDDAERPLSEKGEGQAAQVAAGLQRRGVRLDLLLTSPLLRARQTAEALLRHGPPLVTELETCDELTPGTKRKKLARALLATAKDVVGLVGHQPDLGEFAAWLIGDAGVQLEFAKAGVAFVRCQDMPRKGTGTLRWLVTPEWLA